MNKKKIVYIVHCVDTEGPLYESLSAKFERIKEVFGVSIKSTLENLRKLKSIKIPLNGKENDIATLLSSHLTNYNDINKTFNKIKPDCIVHFGCKNPSYKELKKKKNFFHNNLKAIKNLANFIILNNKKIKLIFPGSSQMYGNKKVIVSENQKFSPNNSYAKFRVSGHKYLMKCKKKKPTKKINLWMKLNRKINLF